MFYQCRYFLLEDILGVAVSWRERSDATNGNYLEACVRLPEVVGELPDDMRDWR